MRVSHETIYRSLCIQARGVLKKALLAHRRSRRTTRRTKRASSEGHPRGPIIAGVSIHQRPAEGTDRAIPGHWEGDLLSGSNNTHMATLVERQSRFTILVRVAGKDTASVVNALIPQVQRLPRTRRRSLTWDRGSSSPWPRRCRSTSAIPIVRGNGARMRIRTGYSASIFRAEPTSLAILKRTWLRLNRRPRKTLAFLTPAEKLQGSVALTG